MDHHDLTHDMTDLVHDEHSLAGPNGPALMDIMLQMSGPLPPFTTDEYPLKPDKVDGAASYDTVLDFISGNLRDTFEQSGKSKAAWYTYCGVSDHEAVNRWLEHPENMKAKHVYKTCELFGVSIDYLRGRTAFKRANVDVWDVELVKHAYRSLNDHHKRLITDILREFVSCERGQRAIAWQGQYVLSRFDKSVTLPPITL